jgi:hypothetical protein
MLPVVGLLTDMPLVPANAADIEISIPFARSAAAAAFVRSVRTFSFVTSVPSASEIAAEHLSGRGADPSHDVLPSLPSTRRHSRPSFANNASAALGPALPSVDSM